MSSSDANMQGDTLSNICREIKSDVTDGSKNDACVLTKMTCMIEVDLCANNDTNMHCALCLSYIILCCARLVRKCFDSATRHHVT